MSERERSEAVPCEWHDEHGEAVALPWA
jgi:hypothetical protein